MTAADFTAHIRSSHDAPIRGFDPLGLVSGWRGYRAYTELASLGDEALAARGLTRKDLPRVALEAMRRG